MKNNNAILFDLFGVLITSGFDSSKQKLCEIYSKTEGVIRPIYEKWEIPFDKGLINAKQFWNKINAELNVDINWRLLNKAVLESYRPIEHSFDLLKRYKYAEPLYLLSNTRLEWYEFLNNKFNISEYFRDTFFSFNYRLTKPNIQIYEEVLKRIILPPSKILYIDDKKDNVQSGLKLGLNSFVFTNVFEIEPIIYDITDSPDIKYSKNYSGVLILSKNDEFILQRREKKPRITNSNLITTFGGVKKDNESYKECAIRELQKKLNISVDSNQLEYLFKLSKPEENESWTICVFYLLKNVQPEGLQIYEGQAIEVLKKDETNIKDLSPICKTALKKYLEKYEY